MDMDVSVYRRPLLDVGLDYLSVVVSLPSRGVVSFVLLDSRVLS